MERALGARMFQTGRTLGITETNDHCREAGTRRRLPKDLEKGRAIWSVEAKIASRSWCSIAVPRGSGRITHSREFQVLVTRSQHSSIPKGREYSRYFKEGREGTIQEPAQINLLAETTGNSAQKSGANFARTSERRVRSIELQCGPTPPTYACRAIIQKSKTPSAALHDITPTSRRVVNPRKRTRLVRSRKSGSRSHRKSVSSRSRSIARDRALELKQRTRGPAGRDPASTAMITELPNA